MGSQAIAYCDCGLHATILIGGGRRDFNEVCLFPALCYGCNHVVQVNLIGPPLSCPKCESLKVKPYTDSSLAKGDGENDVITWGEHHLTDGHYQCPACGQSTLRFRPGGLHWD